MSNLVVNGYENLVLKSVDVIERENKNPLVFVEFIDTDTFESTGQIIYLKEDMNINYISSLKSLEKKPVKATVQINTYNGRSSLSVLDLQPIKQ
jgi:hypothetical protein